MMDKMNAQFSPFKHPVDENSQNTSDIFKLLEYQQKIGSKQSKKSNKENQGPNCTILDIE